MSIELSKQSEKYLKTLGEHWGTGYKPQIIEKALELAMGSEKPLSLKIKKVGADQFRGVIYEGLEEAKTITGNSRVEVRRAFLTYGHEQSDC